MNSDPVTQKIIEHTYGLFGKPILPVQQIAKKLKLSPGRISQIKNKIFDEVSSYFQVVHEAI